MSAAKEVAREVPDPVSREQAQKFRPPAWHLPRRADRRDGRLSLRYHGGRGWAAGRAGPGTGTGKVPSEVNGWQPTSAAGVVR